MTEEAERHLAAVEGVILDATFQKASQRSAVFEAAEKKGAPVAIVHCHSRDELVEERLRGRAEEGRDISDGTWRVYLKQKETFEPFLESPSYLALDTAPPVAELCARAEPFLRATFSGRCKKDDSYRIQPPDSNLLSASR
jgi:predicted kinase